MSSYFHHVILLFKRLALVYAVFFFCRLLFLAFNFSQFASAGWGALFQSFAAGLIFDTSAIVYCFSPFILLHVFPGPWRSKTWYRQLSRGYFTGMVFLCTLANLIDVGYFPFNGRRSGVEVFAPVKDISDQTLSYVISYWYLALLLIGIVFAVIRYYPVSRRMVEAYTVKQFVADVVSLVVVSGLSFLGARGGTSLKPVSVFDAARYADVRLISLTLNTPFQLLVTSQLSDLEERNYIDPVSATAWFNPVQSPAAETTDRKNVVLVIVESMGKEYVGFYNNGNGYTPFVDSLMKLSHVYYHAYANGKRSIEGIPAIIASMPTSMSSDYINTRFQSNRLRGIGHYLSDVGYTSSFYHGCRNGTMGFDNFVAITGSGTYFGLNEYPNPERDFDGHWGIYDEPYLHYVAEALSKQKQPFFSTVFTLSSHHPYPIPADRKALFDKGTLPIHQSIRYADFALREFFKTASAMSWFGNTVFVITADHSAENETPYYQTQQGRYEIPLFVFDPSEPVFKADSVVTIQQADLLPLVISPRYHKPYFAFSNYNKKGREFAVQFFDGYYQFIRWPWVFQFDGNKATGFYNLKADPLMKTNLSSSGTYSVQIKEMQMLAWSYIQQYNHALITNQTWVP